MLGLALGASTSRKAPPAERSTVGERSAPAALPSRCVCNPSAALKTVASARAPTMTSGTARRQRRARLPKEADVPKLCSSRENAGESDRSGQSDRSDESNRGGSCQAAVSSSP